MDLSNTRLKLEREERVRDLINSAGLDALVVFSGGSRGQRGNVRYVSNYSTTSQTSCILWAREGAARLVVPYPVHRLWAEATSWIQDIQVDADYPRAIDRYCQEHGLTRGKIGWAGPPRFLDGVLAAFAARRPETGNQPIQELLTRTRTIKPPPKSLWSIAGRSFPMRFCQAFGECFARGSPSATWSPTHRVRENDRRISGQYVLD